MRSPVLAFALVSLSVISRVGVAQTAEFLAIPGTAATPGRNEDFCGVSGTAGYSGVRVSADGRVVATVVYEPGQTFGGVPRAAARWTRAQGTQIITPPLDGLYPAVGVSADGSVILGESWRWSSATGYQSLLPGLRNEFGVRTSILFGLSDDARTYVGVQGIYPDQGDMVLLPADGSAANLLPRVPQVSTGYFYFNTISGDGRVVGGSTRSFDPADPLVPTSYAAVIVTAAGPTLLTSELDQAGVTDLSFDGAIAVGYASDGVRLRAFRWAGGAGLPLDEALPASDSSYARAVSRDGSAIVGDYLRFGTPGTRAFIWSAENGFEDLQEVLINQLGLGAPLQGWQLLVATDISADGRTIVGQGVNPEGCEQAFFVRLPDPQCRADFNRSGDVSVQDVFDYLLAYFTVDARADINASGDISIQDVFDFFAAHFAGCN